MNANLADFSWTELFFGLLFLAAGRMTSQSDRGGGIAVGLIVEQSKT
jgi:hypothetical protein